MDYQRDGYGRYSQWRSSHRMSAQWQAVCVESAELPLSRIRHAGLELAVGVCELVLFAGCPE